MKYEHDIKVEKGLKYKDVQYAWLLGGLRKNRPNQETKLNRYSLVQFPLDDVIEPHQFNSVYSIGH